MAEKGPETRDEIRALRAKQQQEEKRAAVAHKNQEEISALENAVLQARERRIAQAKKT